MVQVVPCSALYFAVPCTFMGFSEAKEKPINFDANGKVELTNEMIRQAGALFGVDLKDAQDLLGMHKTMTRHVFADWVNACRLHSDHANALAKGTCEDKMRGLWKQAQVWRYVTCWMQEQLAC